MEVADHVAVRMEDMEEPATKKRKMLCDESPTASLAHARTHSGVSVVAPESLNAASSSNFDGALSSCCSSHDILTDATKRNSKFIDLDEEYAEIATSKSNSESSERMSFCSSKTAVPLSEVVEPEHGELLSTPRQEDAKSRRRSTPGMEPLKADVEEWFAAHEKKHRNRFLEKYNFDIVKDAPLKGRYEWVRLNPEEQPRYTSF